MAARFTKITEDDLTAYPGVRGQAAQPGLSVEEQQACFEERAEKVLVPAFNRLCDELEKQSWVELDAGLKTPGKAADAAAVGEALDALKGSGSGAGADGYSPTAKVEQTDTGAVITITDKDGTTMATVTNGYSPVKGTDYYTDTDKAKMVDAALNELPITTDDGYTDISGLRQATAISMTKTDSTVTVTTALEGNVSVTSEITLDADGYPSQIVTDGVTCAVSWEGFD